MGEIGEAGLLTAILLLVLYTSLRRGSDANLRRARVALAGFVAVAAGLWAMPRARIAPVRDPDISIEGGSRLEAAIPAP